MIIKVKQPLHNQNPAKTFQPGQIIEVPDIIGERLVLEDKAERVAKQLPPAPGQVQTAKADKTKIETAKR